jgi:hypothetical protein
MKSAKFILREMIDQMDMKSKGDFGNEDYDNFAITRINAPWTIWMSLDLSVEVPFVKVWTSCSLMEPLFISLDTWKPDVSRTRVNDWVKKNLSNLPNDMTYDEQFNSTIGISYLLLTAAVVVYFLSHPITSWIFLVLFVVFTSVWVMREKRKFESWSRRKNKKHVCTF